MSGHFEGIKEFMIYKIAVWKAEMHVAATWGYPLSSAFFYALHFITFLLQGDPPLWNYQKDFAFQSGTEKGIYGKNG
jgi:hypothetical protein